MAIEITIKDYSEEILEALFEQAMDALEMCGMVAETAAKENITANGSVQTGNLRNSIHHTVSDWSWTCYIGTPVEYGAYVEFGTGKYATMGGGRDTPWVYQDDKGNWHWTEGNRAKPFLKPAVEENADTFRAIIEQKLKQ